MKAKDIATNENARKLYLEWRNHPMTEIVINILRKEGRCQLPPPQIIRAENAIATAGYNVGWHECLDRGMALDVREQTAPDEPKADFGAKDLANEAGLWKPDDKKPEQKPE